MFTLAHKPERIRIIAIPPTNGAPPGFAGEHIREKFVGMEIAVVSGKEIKENPPPFIILDALKKAGGYIVRRADCIEALKAAGNYGTANFLARISVSHYLYFTPEVCEVLH